MDENECVDELWENLDDKGKQTIANTLGFIAALEKHIEEYDYSDW